MQDSNTRAIGLFSGGLDSSLAVCLMRDQGIDVTALHIHTGFSYVERSRLAGRNEIARLSDVERSASSLGVTLEVVDATEEFIPVVLNPRYGYGSGMNPCVDCRIFLLRIAKAMLEEQNYHFVFTGEVVGQRPKSQMRPTLRTVERESGLEGLLLRPLSAKLLEPTVPELRRWVDRSALLDISGRGRKRQIALAEHYGISDYAQPSGGCCYLIDKNYARRLRELLDQEGPEALRPLTVQLLAVGRHFRLPSGARLVVGRHEQENAYLVSAGVAAPRLTTVDHPGPTAVLLGPVGHDDYLLAARAVAAYSDGRHEPRVRIAISDPGGAEPPREVVTVSPVARERVRALAI